MVAAVEDIPADLITPGQAARLVQCHISTIHRWIDTGRIRAWRRGESRYLVREADVRGQLVAVSPAAPVRRPPPARASAADEAVAELRRRGYKV